MRIHFLTAALITIPLLIGCSGDDEPNEIENASSSSSNSEFPQSGSSGSSCSELTYVPTDAAEINRQRQIWEAQGIDNYLYEYRYNTTQFPGYQYNGNFRTKVVDGVAVWSQHVDNNEASNYVFTLDWFFNRAEGSVSFNPQHGYVSAFYSNIPCTNDAYSSFTVTAFAPLDENNITTQERLIAADTNIKTLISDKSCNEDSQCQSIAYGAKACGGPVEYLIYSTQSVDITVLQPLVNEYNLYAEQYNSETGAMSDCLFVTPPDLKCDLSCHIDYHYPSSSSNSSTSAIVL